MPELISAPGRIVAANHTSLRESLTAYTYGIGIGLAILGLAMSWLRPELSLFPLAVLFGWTELSGHCGTSHIATLTPLYALDDRGALWRRAVGAYTTAGTITAACVGAILGAAGDRVGVGESRFYYYAVLGVAVLLAARELDLVRFELPQIRRQTNKMWQFEFGTIAGAAMWGAHIGLGVATVIAHGGFFIVVALCAALGPVKGGVLMVAYWFGRALPLWMGPILARDPARGGSIAMTVSSSPKPYGHIAALGLLCAGVSVVWVATTLAR